MTANCQIIDGKMLAAAYGLHLKEQLIRLRSEHNLVPGLAVLLVGDDPSSAIYVNNKLKAAKSLGINIFEYRMPANTSTKVLTARIEYLNNDHRVHGILVQLPLPTHIDSHSVINQVLPEKDVDGFTIRNIGLLNAWKDSLEPCTPRGILLMLREVFGTNLAGKKAVIIGRSPIVGRPMASMLIREDCTVTVLHSKSKNIEEEARSGEILICATGKPGMVGASWVRKGACVIDVGIVRVGNRIMGDVRFEEVREVASYITPVPGGVGPMTVVCMLGNTVKAACMQKKIPFTMSEYETDYSENI